MRDDAFLRGCLVDGEAESKKCRSWTRRRATAAAVLFEGIIIAGLAICPLFAPAIPAQKFAVVTHIPYLGDAILPRLTRASTANQGNRSIVTPVDFSPPQIVTKILCAPATAIQSVPVPFIGTANPQVPAELPVCLAVLAVTPLPRLDLYLQLFG